MCEFTARVPTVSTRVIPQVISERKSVPITRSSMGRAILTRRGSVTIGTAGQRPGDWVGTRIGRPGMIGRSGSDLAGAVGMADSAGGGVILLGQGGALIDTGRALGLRASAEEEAAGLTPLEDSISDRGPS